VKLRNVRIKLGDHQD